MLLAYRLADAEHADDLEDFPAFIRPLIELEQCVHGSFYINMLATYPDYRNQAVGSTLMGLADKLAANAGCSLLSVEVFERKIPGPCDSTSVSVMPCWTDGRLFRTPATPTRAMLYF